MLILTLLLPFTNTRNPQKFPSLSASLHPSPSLCFGGVRCRQARVVCSASLMGGFLIPGHRLQSSQRAGAQLQPGPSWALSILATSKGPAENIGWTSRLHPLSTLTHSHPLLLSQPGCAQSPVHPSPTGAFILACKRPFAPAQVSKDKTHPAVPAPGCLHTTSFSSRVRLSSKDNQSLSIFNQQLSLKWNASATSCLALRRWGRERERERPFPSMSLTNPLPLH